MIRAFLKDTVVYAIGTVVGRLAGFLMIPLYTRALTPAEYGVVETISRLVDVFGLVIGLGLSASLMRFYLATQSEPERNRLIASTMMVMFAVLLTGGLILLPSASLLGALAFGAGYRPEYGPWVALAVVQMLFSSLITLPLTIFRADGRPWRYTTFSLAQLMTALAANVILVVWFDLGVQGVMWAGTITSVIWGTVLAAMLLSRSGVRPSRVWMRQVVAYGAPLVPASIGAFTLHFADRFFLTRSGTVDEIGLYSLGFRFGMLVVVVMGVLETGFWPWVFRVANTQDGDRHMADGCAVVMGANAVAAAGVILLADPVIRIVADETFVGAARYTALIAISYWFFTAQGPLSVGLRLERTTGYLSAVTGVTALLGLALFSVLVPLYGTWGAVWARLVSFVLLAAGVSIVSQRVRPVPQHWRILAACLVLIGSATIIDEVLRVSSVAGSTLRVLAWAVGAALLLMIVNRSLAQPILSRLRVPSDTRSAS